MKMEISNRDKKLLVYMIAIAIVAGTYFFVAKPFMEKTEALNLEINSLKSDVNHLTEVYINKDSYENRIAEAQRNYNENVANFLGGLNQENTLILLKNIEDDTRVWLSRVSFLDEQIVLGGETMEEGGDPLGLNGKKQDLNLDYSCSYNDYKRFIEYVQNYDKRLFISSMSASYSTDSDRVAGSLVLSQYSLIGTGEEYLAPDLSDVQTGVDNIFTTLKSKSYDESGEITSIEVNSLQNDSNTEDTNNEAEPVEDSSEEEIESAENINDDTVVNENVEKQNNKPATGLI